MATEDNLGATGSTLTERASLPMLRDAIGLVSGPTIPAARNLGAFATGPNIWTDPLLCLRCDCLIPWDERHRRCRICFGAANAVREEAEVPA